MGSIGVISGPSGERGEAARGETEGRHACERQGPEAYRRAKAGQLGV